VLRRSNPVLL